MTPPPPFLQKIFPCPSPPPSNPIFLPPPLPHQLNKTYQATLMSDIYNIEVLSDNYRKLF